MFHLPFSSSSLQSPILTWGKSSRLRQWYCFLLPIPPLPWSNFTMQCLLILFLGKMCMVWHTTHDQIVYLHLSPHFQFTFLQDHRGHVMVIFLDFLIIFLPRYILPPEGVGGCVRAPLLGQRTSVRPLPASSVVMPTSKQCRLGSVFYFGLCSLSVSASLSLPPATSVFHKETVLLVVCW